MKDGKSEISDPLKQQQEIARLTADVDRLRKERDAYREELETIKNKTEESVSAKLRLLSLNLSKEIREDFFLMLRRVLWVIGILGIFATAGGLWTFSDIIGRIVERAVEKREKDIAKLRENIIESVVDFKIEAEKALHEIEGETAKVEKEAEAAVGRFAARWTEVVSASESFSATEPLSATKSLSEYDIITIPVVVHVVYNTEAQNISDTQILSQINVLNQDYRAQNEDISAVPEPFTPYIGDSRIEFALSKRDPHGRITSGITRTETTKLSFSTNNDVKSSMTGGIDPWDTKRYLNIWVCRLKGGLLGYSQFPNGPPKTDGVVISYNAFGTGGTTAAPFDKGRTATAEIGTYLNIIHLWGDTIDCNGTDFVVDTPKQEGPNYGCPSFPRISCNNAPNGDMFMNFMDYCNDACVLMFTKGQVMRMRETLQGPRRALGRR